MDTIVTAPIRDLWGLYCPDTSRDELDQCRWLRESLAHWPSDDQSPVEICDWLAQKYSESSSKNHRKTQGQFFTPPAVARFMARLSAPLHSGALVIDPGAGAGILIAALAEHIAKTKGCCYWNMIAYETDPALRPALAFALGYIRIWLKEREISFGFEIQADDFVLANASLLRPALLFDVKSPTPHLVISNPPYFKVSKADPRVALLNESVHGQPNIYGLFMAAAAKLLQSDGQLIFITPRSFCSGPYFEYFRKWFFRTVTIERLHLFESRTEAFGHHKVLQENIVLVARKATTPIEFVEISSSRGKEDIESAIARRIPYVQVLDLDSPQAAVNIPRKPNHGIIREIFDSWHDRLRSLGLNISTGPIVPFRTAELVTEAEYATTAPVLWIQHVRRMEISWPLFDFNKPQRIRVNSDTRALLLPNTNYVLVRRFSAKEENSRITAAPYFGGTISSEFLGLENHVNYIYRPDGKLSPSEAMGLAAFLNSRWVDDYFRLSSGNTQVSATELRNLPLPPFDKIRRIGDRLEADGINPVAIINQIIGEELGLQSDLPNGSGDHMTKIEEAKDLLRTAGLPPAQRNELAALTLLALANLSENSRWREAERRSIRIHDIIQFVEKSYHRRYAENTRETFRRQVLHQFEQARIVDLNPDEPSLPTNSPRTHYAISQAFLPVVQQYGTKFGLRLMENFIAEQKTLLEVYQQRRSLHLIPLKDSAGVEYRLSPGKHNQLQVATVEQFAPRFAPGSKILYLGDAARKTLLMDGKQLAKLGFPVDKHRKLPDIVLYSPKKKWLFLIEVVTSHGPVSPKRHRELETMLAKSGLGRVYVSIFPDFKEFLRHARNIAWETEVWISDAPDHLIHYNGNEFIGPPRAEKRKSRSSGVS